MKLSGQGGRGEGEKRRKRKEVPHSSQTFEYVRRAK